MTFLCFKKKANCHYIICSLTSWDFTLGRRRMNVKMTLCVYWVDVSIICWNNLKYLQILKTLIMGTLYTTPFINENTYYCFSVAVVYTYLVIRCWGRGLSRWIHLERWTRKTSSGLINSIRTRWFWMSADRKKYPTWSKS